MADPIPTSSAVISIRRASSEDREALMAFYREHHRERPRLTDAALWAWQFVEQPRPTSDLPFFILESDRNVVGGIGYILCSLRMPDREVETILPVNYFIHPAYRGLPALRLLRAALDGRGAAVGAYLSPDALRLLTKMGFVDLSRDLRAYHYSLRSAGGARAVAIALIRRGGEVLRGMTYGVKYRGVKYRVSSEVDDDFFRKCVDHLSLVRLLNSPEWHRWRYVRSPLLNASQSKVLFVYQYRGNEPSALAIILISMQRREAVLLNVIWRPDAPLDSLIDRVLPVARDAGCETITTHCLSSVVEPVLTRCLFAATASDLGLCVWVPGSEARAQLGDSAQWHFMVGDCDAY